MTPLRHPINYCMSWREELLKVWKTWIFKVDPFNRAKTSFGKFFGTHKSHWGTNKSSFWVKSVSIKHNISKILIHISLRLFSLCSPSKLIHIRRVWLDLAWFGLLTYFRIYYLHDLNRTHILFPGGVHAHMYSCLLSVSASV